MGMMKDSLFVCFFDSIQVPKGTSRDKRAKYGKSVNVDKTNNYTILRMNDMIKLTEKILSTGKVFIHPGDALIDMSAMCIIFY